MAHMIYMKFEVKTMALPPVPCLDPEFSDAPIDGEDWEASRLSGFYKHDITLCPSHTMIYHTLRGASICFHKGCNRLGCMGPDGHNYCPSHLVMSVSPTPPSPKVKFPKVDCPAPKVVRKSGVCLVPDEILPPLIEQLQRGGFSKESDLIDELAERFGGDLFDNALHVREYIFSADKAADDMAERLRNIDVIPELPRAVPAPYVPGGVTVPTDPAPAQVTPTPIANPPVAVVVGRVIGPVPPAVVPVTVSPAGAAAFFHYSQ